MALLPVLLACALFLSFADSISGSSATEQPLRKRQYSGFSVTLNDDQLKQAGSSFLDILKGTANKFKGQEEVSANEFFNFLGQAALKANGESVGKRQTSLNANLGSNPYTGLQGSLGLNHDFRNGGKLNTNLGYSQGGGFSGSAGYQYTNRKGNVNFGANLGYGQNSGFSAGASLKIKFR